MQDLLAGGAVDHAVLQRSLEYLRVELLKVDVNAHRPRRSKSQRVDLSRLRDLTSNRVVERDCGDVWPAPLGGVGPSPHADTN